MRICAGIVLYYPDIDRLNKNIEAILPQVDKIYIANNTPSEAGDLQADVIKGGGSLGFDGISWINNEENVGIAKALNQLLTVAANDGFEWILTLDQDSICDAGMVDELFAASTEYFNVAIISPQIIERGKVWQECESDKNISEVTHCITSGSLTHIEAVKNAGWFDEKLFIDEVDRDMCIRLRRLGFRLLRVSSAKLRHEFGDKLIRRRIFFKVYEYRNYSPFRVYYQVRNMVYMVRKYGADYRPNPAWRLVRPFFTFFVKFIFEPQRFARLKAFIKGYKDGLKMAIY